MLEAYRAHVAERAALGILPLPLSKQQTTELVGLLRNPPKGEEAFLLDLITNRVPAGVDDAAKVKAEYLAEVAKGEEPSSLISKVRATELLGTMLGGFNIKPLIDLLACPECGAAATQGLKNTLLMFDFFNDVKALATSDKPGSANAKAVMQSWADAEWFTSRPGVPESLTVTIFKVTGETNTDDLSPAPDAWTRPDIPLHALAMLKNARAGIEPDQPGKVGPIKLLQTLKEKGHLVAYAGDVVGTGSSRKSATNSVLWWTGEDIPYVPNKRFGGVCLGSKIAPIFFNTMEDAGALPIELDVSKMETGDVIELRPLEGKALKNGEVVAEFKIKSDVILDEVQAGGRIPLIVGRALTSKARAALGLPPSTLFRLAAQPADTGKGYTLAQKIVGRACGLPEGKGVRPGAYCEPKMTTVGSQDTTGPMTRDEMKDLACMGFSAGLVLQSFCHTAAYPKPVDVKTHATLPDFISGRAGVSLRPGDGVIHTWLNRMLLPDTVGTGGDSHTRFPLGISFPAGSGLVAFAAATGMMPLDMPESVLVRFKGTMQPGITLRDLVNAVPYAAIQKGLLTVEKKGKRNVFSGVILEIEGLENLKVEQAFELANASAERSAAASTVRLAKEPVIEYVRSNVALLKWMVANCYEDASTIERRIAEMEARMLAAESRVARTRCRCGICRRRRDRHERDQGADPRLPERSGRRETSLAGCRRQDRRGFHRQLHDEYRPLPRRRQSAAGQDGNRIAFVDRPADEDGRGSPDAGRLLQLLRGLGRSHRDARLFALHGKSGADPQRFDRDVDFDAQLPEPPRHRYARLSRLGRTCRGVRAARTHPDGRRVHAAYRGGQQTRRRRLPLHELRPDRRISKRRNENGGLTQELALRRSPDEERKCKRKWRKPKTSASASSSAPTW